jgi:hypothetical protein
VANSFVLRSEASGAKAASHLKNLFDQFQEMRHNVARLRAEVALSAVVCEKSSLKRTLGELDGIDDSLVQALDGLADSISEVTISVSDVAPAAAVPGAAKQAAKILSTMTEEPTEKKEKKAPESKPAGKPSLTSLLKNIGAAGQKNSEASGGSLPPAE